MNREDIIRMAREAGISVFDAIKTVVSDQDGLERFAALVAAAEREACAKTCEELRFSALGPSTQAKFQRDLCAKAIRARGESK